MGVLSILPESFMVVELWVTRLFLLLGIITIGPWVGLLVYDFLLYCYRATAYEIPFVGGRAKGKARPRAPSLTERPSGHRRGFSLGRRHKGPAETTGGFMSDLPDPRFRHISEEADGQLSSA